MAFDFVEPARLFARSGLTPATANLYVAMQEFDDIAFAVHMPRPGDLFRDVGANIGAYTILASVVSGARGIAFEPVSSTYDLARTKHSIEWIGRESRRDTAAVGAKIGTARIPSNLDTGNHVLPNNSTSDATASEQVEVRRRRHLLRRDARPH